MRRPDGVASVAAGRGWTWSEQYRHECEVRFVLAMPSRVQRAGYLMDVEKQRGKGAADRLRDDVRAAWKAG